jgi:hypothetical protein
MCPHRAWRTAASHGFSVGLPATSPGRIGRPALSPVQGFPTGAHWPLDLELSASACDLEIAVADYIDWFNDRRLHGEIGLVPQAEQQASFHRYNTAGTTTAAASVPSLHCTRCLTASDLKLDPLVACPVWVTG